jgi:hypothetical protein
MKISFIGAELFRADGQAHDEARRFFFFLIWQTRLDTGDRTTGYEK